MVVYFTFAFGVALHAVIKRSKDKDFEEGLYYNLSVAIFKQTKFRHVYHFVDHFLNLYAFFIFKMVVNLKSLSLSKLTTN